MSGSQGPRRGGGGPSLTNWCPPLHFGSEDVELALEQMREAQGLARELGKRNEEAIAKHNLAFLYLQKKEYRRAKALAEESAALFAALEEKRNEGSSWLLAAKALGGGGGDQAKLQDAIGLCAHAQEVFAEARDLLGEYEASRMLATLSLRSNLTERALSAAERGLEVSRRYRNQRLESQALRNLAQVQVSADHLEKAQQTAALAREAAAACDHRAEMTHAQLLTTHIYMESYHRGQDLSDRQRHRLLEQSLRSSLECAHLSNRCNDAGLVALARFARAQLLLGTERPQEAQSIAEEALKWFGQAADSLGEIRTELLLGAAALAAGRFEQSFDLAKSCRKKAKQLGRDEVVREAEDLLQQIKEKSKAPVMATDSTGIRKSDKIDDKQTAEVPAADEAKAVEEVAVVPRLDPDFVRAKITELTKDLVASEEALEPDMPFMEAGMDSLSSVQLMTEMGKEFQMSMSPSLVFDYPTINALVAHVVEESGG